MSDFSSTSLDDMLIGVVDLMPDLQREVIDQWGDTYTSLTLKSELMHQPAKDSVGVSVEADTTSPFMKEINGQMELFKNAMDILEDSVVSIEEAAVTLRKITTDDEETVLQRDVARLVTRTNGIVLGMKRALDNMKNHIQVAKEQAGGSMAGEILIAQNNHQAVSKKLRSEALNYQNAQVTFKEGITGKIRRKLVIVAPELEKKDIDDLVQQGDGQVVKQVLVQRMTASEDMAHAVASVQDKYEAVRMLEKSVAQLHQLFVDLAVLVDVQGERLDNIEANVQAAAEYAEEANKDLVKALENKKKRQKVGAWESDHSALGSASV
ncbi:MAG: hypothetical protein KVP17_000517 [Porospora cf. gigantea B]|uniref:uncharacterized protein n=1 Tax=Porospora cf. gigantea B TaxID=2853592 RepID=UPI0035719CE3|nr:MAG: hypothetical protein KVP17_000517 [Porospora cf. gigantea B]